jgi:hypothetical protein
MRRLAFSLFLGLALWGCGGGGDSDGGGSTADRQAILQVMDQGRSALLKGDAAAACALLTPHGRERTLQYQVDFLKEGTRVPSTNPQAPQSCGAMVPAVLDELGAPLISTIKSVDFQVVSIDEANHRATVDASRDGYTEATFRLQELSDDGWRIDDSNDVPSGY